MLKLSILLNSVATMLVMVLNFAFKIYLAKHFSQLNLVAYYTILDMFSIITRIFAGYKDALTTVFYTTKKKLHVLKMFTILFGYVIFFIAIIIIPVGINFYLKDKIDSFSLSWVSVSALFVLMNIVSYFGYLFLIYKEYKIISLYDILKSLFVIFFILMFYKILGFDSTYKTLIYATISANFMLLIFLFYQKNFIFKKISFNKLLSFSLPIFDDDTKERFIKLTFMASGKYFIYGILLFAPVFVMLHFKQLEDLADFQVVARSIYFALVAIFSWPLGRFMFVEFSSLIDKKEFVKLEILKRKFIKVLIPFSLLLFITTWVFSKYLISFLFPIEYQESYKMLNILIVALPFVMYTNYSESIIKAFGDYKTNLLINIGGIFIFIFIFIFLEFIFYIRYASIYAFVISMIAIFLFSIFVEKNLINNEKNR